MTQSDYVRIAAIAGGAIVALWILWAILARLFRRQPPVRNTVDSLDEDLLHFPKPEPSTGDRQLRVEGVPVRLRLLVLAPAGRGESFDQEALEPILDAIIPGLGGIVQSDKPRIRIWPAQLSYEGFAHSFHRHTKVPARPGEMTPWVLVAGRARVGNRQVMIGLAMLAVKPTTIGRRTLDVHEWPQVVRVRVRE